MEKFSNQRTESQIVSLMVSEYMKRYDHTKREVLIPEHSIGLGKFTGYIDGIKDRTTIIEDKFKSQWTAIDEAALATDDQVAGYIHSYSLIACCSPSDIDVLYRVTRKPSLRQRKDETNDEFLLRIHHDVINRPDFYFIEVPINMTDDQVMDWHADTVSISKLMNMCMSNEEWPMNRSSCKSYGSLCSFFSLCSAMDELEAESVLHDHYKVREERERKVH